VLAHDPSLEGDGFLSLARAAEVKAVPAMFGFGAGEVKVISAGEAHGGAPIEEYDVTWAVPSTSGAGVVATGLAVGLGAIALATAGPLVAAGVAAGAAVAGATGLVAWVRDQQGKADSNAQRIRIRALERSVTLKEERERAAVGFLEGSVIAGKYRLGPKLGSGGSGVIHRATRLEDNVQVAIKLLRAAVAHDTVASDRLRREAEALGLAWHPNVVEVYEHDTLSDGTSYLVMEYLPGESLATRLKRTPRLPPQEILPIAMQICDAMVSIHKAGIIHRDIKPGNIFLVPREGSSPPSGETSSPRRERVKLLDFGIARVDWAETRLTSMGAALGTPGYMSPEQEKGGEIDVRSDIFALGAVLYECLTGQPPPTSSTGLWRATRAGGAPGDTTTIPPEWRRLLERAMDPVPRARFRDAKTMREALDGLAEDLGMLVQTQPPPSSVRRTAG
jgi:serine/threonine-protein kinase